MYHYVELVVTIVCAILGSNGIWILIQRQLDKKDTKTKMLIGLGHDRIMQLGMSYLERGCVTPDELENLVDYLYTPYHELGGNGTAKQIVDKVQRLEMCRIANTVPHKETFGEGGKT